MSYDVSLLEPKTKLTIQFDDKHQFRGGTYAVGGTDEAELNITWNYTAHIERVLTGGIRGLYGKTGAETIGPLTMAIDLLHDDPAVTTAEAPVLRRGPEPSGADRAVNLHDLSGQRLRLLGDGGH